MKNYQLVIKRTFDIAASLAGLIALLPFAFVVMLAVKLTSRGPVFYIQERIGRYGKPFNCVKFRTMTVGADAHGSITSASDRRITSAGRILRRFKLDEFPQLWNVLIGKMSFVGPRPDVPGYADLLAGDNRKILELRPGITGPASLFFRYEEELLAGSTDPVLFNDERIWPIKISINRCYAEQLSFFRDIGFILVTVLPLLNKLFRVYPASPRTIEEFDATLHSVAGTNFLQ